MSIQYKHKLVNRFLEITEDINVFDQDLALMMKTSDLESLGIILAEAQKQLQNIINSNPTFKEAFESKKHLMKVKEVQSGKRQLPTIPGSK
jgi:mevalonate kinase